MKELIIFLFLFLVVFTFSLFIFNGRFIYAQAKYRVLGPSPIGKIDLCTEQKFSEQRQEQKQEEQICKNNESYQIPQRIIIPSLGLDAPIVWPEDTSEPALQKALERGVVFWPNSSLPEDKGTMIILGHSSAYPWYKGDYGSIFSLLNKLNIGDEINIYSPNKKYTYQIASKEINLPKNLTIENQERESVLYLLSCWPIRTDWKRIAIKAVAIDNK